MNELTRAATEKSSLSSLPGGWVTPTLLGFLSLASVGNYSAINTGNDALHSLQASVAETNRLAEMRGATQVEVATLRKEVEKLRTEILRRQTVENSEKDFDTLRKAVLGLREAMDETVPRMTVMELTNGNRELILQVAKTLDSYVTHKHLDKVVGRIDAISRRITGPTKSR